MRRSSTKFVLAVALALSLLTALASSAPCRTTDSSAHGRGATARDWGTCSAAAASPATTWYFAEGCTEAGFETWILVQNPGGVPCEIAIDLQSADAQAQGPRDTIPPRSRRTYNLADYVVSYEVSATVRSSAPVVCERAMYGNNREWGTDSMGSTATSETWFLAEGCTDGGIETWVLVQNPGTVPARIDMKLQTGAGERQGPTDIVPPMSRRTYNLADYVRSFDVSTKITASAGVVCERAMYGAGREWGTESTGITTPSRSCYLAEGCTLDGFETWVLVANPGLVPASLRMTFLTERGQVDGPNEVIPAGCRRSYRVSDYANGASVAATIGASEAVVVERAMYGGGRLWGSCSSGSATLSRTWYLAEGCTQGGFETWLALVNPGDEPVRVTVNLQTEKGEVKGPTGTVEPKQRRTFDLGEWVTSYDVSALVESSGPLACERSMYGDGTNSRLCAPVDGPPLYPFTREESIACGHWPSGSTDYPYFGAPRNGTRLHAGIDIYPPSGEGSPVAALKAGTVMKAGLFYTRYTGEETFAVLVDHGDFVANYAELRPLESWVQPGAPVERGQLIGYVSGTVQLHFEMYTPGTTSWLSWYGPQPANLIDPTDAILRLY